jgi:flagellar biosynthesis protein FliR
MTILDTSGQHICMFIAWSTIESFDHFENSDCPENVFARNINWNLLSFAVFLNGCLSLYQFCVTFIYKSWKYPPVRTISLGEQHYDKMA